jgi:recombination associated protein RdgC
MAFLGGSASLRTFTLKGTVPARDGVIRGLEARSFKEDEIGAGGETSMGWVTRRDLFDVDFDEGAVLIDRHAVFGLRIDKRSVPASLLGAHVARQERAWRRDNAKDFVPRAVRSEIRSEEKDRLMAMLPATPTVCPVLWNLADGRVHLGALTSARAEALTRLFHESWGLTLEPHGPEERADSISGVRQKIRTLSPLDFAQGQVLPKDGEGDASFLGRDFLTWLLYRTEQEGGDLELDKWGRLGVFFEDRMAFEGENHSCRLQVLQQGHPSGSAEAKTALLLGKKLVQARLTLAADDEEMWKLTIDADTLDLRSVRFPRTESSDPESRLLDRLDTVERVFTAVDALYRAFLNDRTKSSFLEDEGPLLKSWARSRQSDGDDLFK